MVLIFIFLMTSDVEHLFICLLVISMSSLEKYQFRDFAYIFIGFFVFLLLSCVSSLCILDVNPLSRVPFQKCSPADVHHREKDQSDGSDSAERDQSQSSPLDPPHDHDPEKDPAGLGQGLD